MGICYENPLLSTESSCYSCSQVLQRRTISMLRPHPNSITASLSSKNQIAAAEQIDRE
jgi:hypothetical protein